MYKDKEEANLVNNKGFCELLIGRLDEGLSDIETALAKGYDPLFEMNKGIALFLLQDTEKATQSLIHAMDWLNDNPKNKYSNDNPLYVLLLHPCPATVRAVPDVPLIAAIHINLSLMGKETTEQLEENLQKVYPETYKSLLLLVEDSALKQE